jgi:hypothetical protein
MTAHAAGILRVNVSYCKPGSALRLSFADHSAVAATRQAIEAALAASATVGEADAALRHTATTRKTLSGRGEK